MKSVTVSAPGKIHLMGDHAIVHGKPALLSAINRRTTVTIEEQKAISKERNNRYEIVSSESPDAIRQAIHIIEKKLRIQPHNPIRIVIHSTILPGYHLGSSASVSVALTGALMNYWKDFFVKEEINDIAYKIEQIFHGNPSGGDNTTVTYGGYMWYRKETEFLKLFSQIPKNTFLRSMDVQNFFLINTGRPRETTGDMVASVKRLFDAHPALKRDVLNANEQATKLLLESLYTGHEDDVIRAIRDGEKTLEAMQVVSKKVIPCIRDIEKAGGAVKILGGGGKTDGVGYLLCYYRHHDYAKGKQVLASLVSRHSYTLEDIRLGEEGVRLENVD